MPLAKKRGNYHGKHQSSDFPLSFTAFRKSVLKEMSIMHSHAHACISTSFYFSLGEVGIETNKK